MKNQSINPLDDITPGSVDLGSISTLIQDYDENMERKLIIEQELAEINERNRIITEDKIPSMMEGFNLLSLSLGDGTRISVKSYVSASIPSQGSIDKEKDPGKRSVMKEIRNRQFSWLRDNNGEDIIKNRVEMEFGRNEDGKCNEVIEDLHDKGILYKRTTGVHYKVLNGFIGDLMEEGKSVDMQLFNVSIGKRATIKRG